MGIILLCCFVSFRRDGTRPDGAAPFIQPYVPGLRRHSPTGL
jgi:hypothetical protein